MPLPFLLGDGKTDNRMAPSMAVSINIMFRKGETNLKRTQLVPLLLQRGNTPVTPGAQLIIRLHTRLSAARVSTGSSVANNRLLIQSQAIFISSLFYKCLWVPLSPLLLVFYLSPISIFFLTLAVISLPLGALIVLMTSIKRQLPSEGGR